MRPYPTKPEDVAALSDAIDDFADNQQAVQLLAPPATGKKAHDHLAGALAAYMGAVHARTKAATSTTRRERLRSASSRPPATGRRRRGSDDRHGRAAAEICSAHPPIR
jgi:hypothetical protein